MADPVAGTSGGPPGDGNDPRRLIGAARAALEAGQLERAFALCRAVLARDGDQIDAIRIVGRVLEAAGELRPAIDAWQAVVDRVPGSAVDRCNLGTLLARAGAYGRARAELETAVRLAPNDAAAWCGLGIVLRRLKDGSAARRALERAVALERSAAALANLGNVLADAAAHDEAIAAYREALAADPGNRTVRASLANVLARIGHDAEARAILLDGTPDAQAQLLAALCLPVIPESTAAIVAARARLSATLDRLEQAPAALDPQALARTAFHLAYHGLDDRPLQERLAGAYRRLAPGLAFAAPPPSRGPGAPIRVGFVSEHFRQHTIFRLCGGLIRGLDRARFAVTVFATPDADRALLATLAAPVEILDPADLAGARATIARRPPDVLFFTDLGMAPFTMLLAHARLAPVQCAWWGHPDTTGIPTVDWFVSCDAMEPPDAPSHYSERLARLPGPTVRYERPPVPERAAARAALGFAPDETVYVCPQALFKFHPDFDAALRAILAGHPGATLSIIAGEHPNLTRQLRDRLLGPAPALAARLRVHPAMPRADFLALLAAADVMLDPFHYSGGNTSLEAFAAGTPIVTWPGAFMRGRHTAGFYRLMGYDGCIARDPAHYVDLALALGRDPAARAAAAAAIGARCGVLFDDGAAVTELERFLERAVAAGPDRT